MSNHDPYSDLFFEMKAPGLAPGASGPHAPEVGLPTDLTSCHTGISSSSHVFFLFQPSVQVLPVDNETLPQLRVGKLTLGN